MCRKVSCNGCGKATWQGCGLHIDSALQGVADSDRCAGWETGDCPTMKSSDSDNDNTDSNRNSNPCILT